MAYIEEDLLTFESSDNDEVGSIERFFKECNLHVKFTTPFMHEQFINMFEHFYKQYPTTENDIIEELKESYEYETNRKMNPEIYISLMKEDNDIVKLYYILEPKYNVKRNKAVHIDDEFETVYTGAKQSYVNIEKLQEWVNVFHSYEFENITDKTLCGFILYLLYVRIHPHFDGNGRMGRYLFLENKLLIHNLCPLSLILNNDLEKPTKQMNEIFEWLDKTVNNETAKESDYYEITIPKIILRKIYYIIYISTCFKYCCKVNANFKKVILEGDDDYRSIFCLCKGCHEVGTSTTVKISKAHGLNNQRFAAWLNSKFFNYEQHKKIITVMCGISV